MIELKVKLPGGIEYPITAGAGWPDYIKSAILKRKHSRIFIVSQRNLDDLIVGPFLSRWADLLGSDARERLFLMVEGEEAKQFTHLEQVYNQLIRQGIDRHAAIFALGGGVVGDFAGFVAATILRGVAFYQFPTTLLAAVDSSVGGKVAVNVALGKNMVGAFYQPRMVCCNTDHFLTLSEREWRCGLAEMIKHAFLDPEGRLLGELRTHMGHLRDPQSDPFHRCLLDSIAFKAGVVSQDEHEHGLRAILNLGHTTAHALESLTHYQRFAHGEAVSRGLFTMLLLSRRLAGLSQEDFETMRSMLEALELPLDTAGLVAGDLYHHMLYDKKSVAGSPRFILLAAPGRPLMGQEVTEADFRLAWDEQKERYG